MAAFNCLSIFIRLVIENENRERSKVSENRERSKVIWCHYLLRKYICLKKS